MLRGLSIRSKLMLTFGLLGLVFVVLATTGVWGLSRYGQLADSVSRRTAEIPYPHKLNALAVAMKDTMVDEGFLGGSGITTLRSSDLPAIHASDYMTYAIMDFELTLDLYEAEIQKWSAITQVADDAQQLADLTQIKESFLKVSQAYRRSRLLFSPDELHTQLGGLCDLTSTHLEQMQRSIELFRVEVKDQYKSYMRVGSLCLALTVVMIVLLWGIFRSYVAKPFQNLLVGCRLVAEGQFSHRIDLGTQDELSELAQAMNLMSERFMESMDAQRTLNRDLDRQVKARSREVIQNEQLASVGFLAAGVAHEINNPLQSVAFSTDILNRQIEDLVADSTEIDHELHGEIKRNLQRVQDEAFRCSKITKRLLDFSRLGDVERTQINVCELVEGVVEIVRKVGKFRCKTIQTHGEESVYAHINSHEIQQVVLNLVTNALESVDTDGQVDVYIRKTGGMAHVIVQDNGCGMTPEVIDHLFEPFFTRRRDGTGTGLGLSISRRIVSQHRGSLTADSDGEGQGSRLEMMLPIQAYQSDSTSLITENQNAKQAA